MLPISRKRKNERSHSYAKSKKTAGTELGAKSNGSAATHSKRKQPEEEISGMEVEDDNRRVPEKHTHVTVGDTEQDEDERMLPRDEEEEEEEEIEEHREAENNIVRYIAGSARKPILLDGSSDIASDEGEDGEMEGGDTDLVYGRAGGRVADIEREEEEEEEEEEEIYEGD